MVSTAHIPELSSATSQPTSKEVLQHLAHELRQPLSALESITYYLRLTNGDSSPMGHQLSRVQHLVDHANWVLADMLSIHHPSPPSPSAVDCLELLRDVADERWITDGLAMELPANEVASAFADAEQLRHLLRTAFYFFRSPDKQIRPVKVTVEECGDWLCLEIQVQAPEADPETFYVPLASRSLLACRNIAQANGGTFRVHHEPGGATTVRLDLPVAELQ